MKKLLLFTGIILLSGLTFGQTDLFFSEYVEGGGNNKSLEIYNPTENSINTSDYQIARYRNGLSNPNYEPIPEMVIEPYDVLVITLDKRDPNGTEDDTMVAVALQNRTDIFLCPNYDVSKAMYFNGNDAMTLEKISNGALVDIVGVIGQDPDQGWCDNEDTFYMTSNFWEAWTQDHTMIRKPNIVDGVTSNPTYFNPAEQWDTLPKNTFDHLQWHTSDVGIGSGNAKIKTDFLLFPNPASTQITIQGAKNLKEISVFSAIGQIALKESCSGYMAKATLNIEDFISGIYFIKVEYTDGTTHTQKLRVQ